MVCFMERRTLDVNVNRELIVELTRDLIRFESVNPPGNEREAAEYLGNRLHHMGLEVELQQLEPSRSNVIARLSGAGNGHLVLTGHLDVVPPGGQPWSHDPFAADMVDGRIYGRGSADMKGGVASMVGALDALCRGGFKPKADVILAATAGEEAGMVGATAMVERDSLTGSRYLVVGEPSGLDVFIGEKGVLWVEVRALGRTAHGSMPWLGVNAVSFLSRLISRLEDEAFPFVESPLLGKPTMSVNIFEGGKKTNVVPDLARAVLDMRTVPGQDHAAIVERINTIAEEMARQYHSDLRVEVAIENEQKPLETDRGDSLVDAAVASVESVRGTSPKVGGVTYGTDAAQLGPGFGIPMVICGPGDPGMAHQPDENVEVEQLVLAAEIYADLAQRLVG
jgi:succinyl-diaminopimelate desuccinylase